MVNKRTVYLDIKNKYLSLTPAQRPRLTESTLFLTAPISVNKNVYTFDPLENPNQPADEARLNINDEFTIAEMGVYLYGTITDAAAATSTSQLLTAIPFDDLAVGQSLKSGNLWAGFMSILVNNIKYLEKYDLRKLNMAEIGRMEAFGNTAFDFKKEGVIEMQPMITLSGSKKNEITLTLPDTLAPFTFVETGSAQNTTITIDRIAVMLRGLNAQNMAKFQ